MITNETSTGEQMAVYAQKIADYLVRTNQGFCYTASWGFVTREDLTEGYGITF